MQWCMKTLWVFVLSFFFIHANAQDSLTLRKGGIIRGVIVHSNPRQVMIESGPKVYVIPRRDISGVYYSASSVTRHRWGLGLMPGITLWGTGREVYDLLNKNHLEQTTENGARLVSNADPALFLEATYSVQTQWKIGITAGLSNTGRINAAKVDNPSDKLSLFYSTTTVAPFVRWSIPNQYLSAIAGPVAHFWQFTQREVGAEKRVNVQPGLLLGLSASGFERSRTFLRFQAYYFMMNKDAEIGPYYGDNGSSELLLPAEKISFDHFVFGIVYGKKW